jgi:hypothetical protein
MQPGRCGRAAAVQQAMVPGGSQGQGGGRGTEAAWQAAGQAGCSCMQRQVQGQGTTGAGAASQGKGLL